MLAALILYVVHGVVELGIIYVGFFVVLEYQVKLAVHCLCWILCYSQVLVELSVQAAKFLFLFFYL